MYFKYTAKTCGIFLLLLCCLFVSGCRLKNKDSNKEGGDKPLKLQDLAFNRSHNLAYRIGIEENGKIVPYRVLTDDYNGNCLVLREHLLDEPRKYNIAKRYSAYYENSEMDTYLNGEFIKRFSSELINDIVDSTIVITDKDSLGIGGEDTTTIARKIFLLSFTEMNRNTGSRSNLKEGEQLEYFAEDSNRIAYYDNGKAGSWWLRTANTGSRDVVCGVSPEGVIGIGGIHGTTGEFLNGVRPAFCLSRETKVTSENDELYLLVRE